ncbi:hypothetical protein A3D88_03655 [Candidatus Peribacteria bacterium RIFCSPHIGHO2_02_FULL_52_16]|nr:MAG: hypothetical protein A2706_04470 [Candidatus Peribacteria bacterium RIFCSPHIGHO2_01_FULL_51_35]OGJ61779.1 MAG: hypothetical protein A3D88_03655 [Candidatus Peribacteria bacterium RIFCSPHIGHO2_02_FULL_52_16]
MTENLIPQGEQERPQTEGQMAKALLAETLLAKGNYFRAFLYYEEAGVHLDTSTLLKLAKGLERDGMERHAKIIARIYCTLDDQKNLKRCAEAARKFKYYDTAIEAYLGMKSPLSPDEVEEFAQEALQRDPSVIRGVKKLYEHLGVQVPEDVWLDWGNKIWTRVLGRKDHYDKYFYGSPYREELQGAAYAFHLGGNREKMMECIDYAIKNNEPWIGYKICKEVGGEGTRERMEEIARKALEVNDNFSSTRLESALNAFSELGIPPPKKDVLRLAKKLGKEAGKIQTDLKLQIRAYEVVGAADELQTLAEKLIDKDDNGAALQVLQSVARLQLKAILEERREEQ